MYIGVPVVIGFWGRLRRVVCRTVLRSLHATFTSLHEYVRYLVWLGPKMITELHETEKMRKKHDNGRFRLDSQIIHHEDS